MEYVFGTPSAEESSNLWKRFPGEADVTGDEHETASSALETHLSYRYTLWKLGVQGDLYVRGDFFGDRTQYVELYLPELISRDFISYLQDWLRDYEDGSWRIIIRTGLGDAMAFVIYPDTVRLGAEWEADLNEALTVIPQLMRASDEGKIFNPKRIS